jgi:hypothetical protein
MLMRHCEKAAIAAGFYKLCLGATLPGQRLYETHGFIAGRSEDYDLGRGLTIQVVPMTKNLAAVRV